MANLPALNEFPLFRESEEFKGGVRTTLAAYYGIIAFSICVMAAGVITGVEQGRKPLLRAKSDATEAARTHERLTQVAAQIASGFKPLGSLSDFQIVQAERNLEIQFGTANIFLSGQADLSSTVEANVKELALVIYKLAPKAKIKVESYTDDAPMVSGATRYPSNWELSGARAARILRTFEKSGFPAENLTFVGLGETHPLYPNRDSKGAPLADNRMRNRRVVIQLSDI